MIHNSPFRAPPRRRGFTLIEVMVGLVILLGICVGGLLGMTAMLQESRVAKMRVTAASALRKQAEEVWSVAADQDQSGNIALLVLQYYAKTFDETAEALPLGPGRTVKPRVELIDGGAKMIYRFPIRNVGENARNRNNEYEINYAAVGTVTFYLDETAVEPSTDAPEMWRDLGTTTNSLATGFDMNRDGKITPQTVAVSMNLLKNNPERLDIEQMPVDVSVVFYANDRHQQQLCSLERRLVLTEMNQLAYLLDP